MPFYQAVKTPRAGTGSGFLNAIGGSKDKQPGGFYSAVNGARTNKDDLSSVDGLLKLAREKGLTTDAEDIANEDKLSFLQRLSSGLGALNPAEAIARDYEGTENFLTAYPRTVLEGISSAVTGNDYGEQTKRRYFGDLLKDMGVENKYARFGLGLVGDIFLDPETYVGGTIIRGAIKGLAIPARVGGRAFAKAAPEAAESFLTAGRALKDA